MIDRAQSGHAKARRPRHKKAEGPPPFEWRPSQAMPSHAPPGPTVPRLAFAASAWVKPIAAICFALASPKGQPPLMSIVSRLRFLNPEMVGALLRTAVQVGGGVISSRGWMNDDEWSLIGGALVTLIVTGWGVYVRRDKALIQSAAAVPAVSNVVVDRGVEAASASLTANQKVNA